MIFLHELTVREDGRVRTFPEQMVGIVDEAREGEGECAYCTARMQSAKQLVIV